MIVAELSGIIQVIVLKKNGSVNDLKLMGIGSPNEVQVLSKASDVVEALFQLCCDILMHYFNGMV